MKAEQNHQQLNTTQALVDLIQDLGNKHTSYSKGMD